MDQALPSTPQMPSVAPVQSPTPSPGSIGQAQAPAATPTPIQSESMPQQQAPVASEPAANGAMPTSASQAAPATNGQVQQPSQMIPPDLQPELQKPELQSPDVAPLPQVNPSNSIPQTAPNGDNSKVTGDQPMAVSDSIQALTQKEAQTRNNVSNINTADVVNRVNSGSSLANEDHTGASYDQIRNLGEIVENAHMPDELKKLLNERIARLALIRSGAGFTSSTYILEYEATSRYINWVVGLPWDKKTQDTLDLSKAREVLNKNHYGLDALKERVLEYIASIILNIQNYGADSISRAPILCFVGLAGTGKTTFAKSVAEALGRQFERIPFGGMADSRVLRGQSRYFPDAEPGAIVKKLVHASAKNPVILLDELDRVTETARADIMGVLIELLDPEQNYSFTDHYVDYPFNLSNILFIATANNTTSISTAVLDRLEIIQMPSYNDDEKIMIGKSYVFRKAQQMAGLKQGQVVIDDAVWPDIVRPLGFDSGVRSLERAINTICRKTAELIVEGQAQAVLINQSNVGQFVPQW